MFKRYDNMCDTTINNPLVIEYKNWKNEVNIRTIIPQEVWFGNTEFHHTEQWIMKAYDVNKQAMRDFAIKDIIRIL